MKNENFEGHDENEMNVNEITWVFFKDAVFHLNVQIKKPPQICFPICSSLQWSRAQVSFHIQKQSIFKVREIKIAYFTENSRSKWCMLY